MPKVLALTTDGRLTYCTCSEDQRGKGRCNHITHQSENQSTDDFIKSISDKVFIETGEIKNQDELIKDLVALTSKRFNENPDWSSYINESVNKYFVIGKTGEEERPEVVNVDQTFYINENGDPVCNLKANLQFRGEQYTVDLGDVPEVQEDGTIIMNGSKFRVLPILSQYKSGIACHKDTIVVKQENGYLAFVLDKENPGIAKIGNDEVPIEEIGKAIRGEESSLTPRQLIAIQHIDPIAFERSEELSRGNVSALYDMPEDHPADLSYRKVITMEDQIQGEMDKQFRRMGVTFRTNLKKREELSERSELTPEAEEKLPLFYQKNNTDNIKSELITRSNTQLADNLNPLSALSQAHKISLTGPGGYNKDKAPNELRHIHPSHKGIVDSLDTSSGKNIGLTISLNKGDIDERGFIVTGTKSEGLGVSDFIPFKNHSEPVRASMAVAHMKQACPLVHGEDPKPLGDKSDKNWERIRGSKLGVNLNVAYLPTENTWEDGVTISESAARKMATVQSYDYKPNNWKVGKYPKVGESVRAGDIVAGERVKYNGVIKSVEPGSKYTIESTFAMGVGDKIAGRHGNKGVVTKVLPDSEMPKIDKGNGRMESAEVLISPNSVVGRGNLSQIYETNNGDFNKVTRVKLSNGTNVNSTAGTQFIMRLNHIAEKKIISYSGTADRHGEAKSLRLGEMESLLLTNSRERLEVLDYLRHQETRDTHQRFDSLMKAIGVKIESN